ncbi:putative cytochrome p450 protein [Eutypa lata UCREL1]|uniref:Putative cytochrome p450 protein n=1 Tax=Eutypa lata (strain UCR-EL1) TaxID=1287681 RepID=M7TSQ1_EUTLA|nr:putative cytochrome p450 protein [Eutypa lata UCREL1]
MSVVFGRRTSMREKSVRELFYCIDEFMKLQGSPSASFMDGFPVIARLLPIRLQWYRKDAERVFRETLQVYENFFDDLQKRIEEGEDPRCFGRSLVELSKHYKFTDEQQYFCAGTIIEAGSDTTRNQINIMLAAAAKFPGWVKKAREELDRVLGTAARLPTFDDWDSLPYLLAVMKETLRWRPNMTPTGVPRVLVEDDAVGPYKFEKGTVFTWNHYGISHSEHEFENNEIFTPERFLNEDLKDMLKGHWGFGMGKRNRKYRSTSISINTL